jgi:hypothetical protein
MMTPPIMRVLTPQLVWCTWRSCCCSSTNCVLNATAKFVPRLWLVPAYNKQQMRWHTFVGELHVCVQQDWQHKLG